MSSRDRNESAEKPSSSNQASDGEASNGSVDGGDDSRSDSESKDTSNPVEEPPLQEEEAPPLPDEQAPPLPTELPPTDTEDDGWAPVWDDRAQAYYFYNRFTNTAQWENPRVPEATQPGAATSTDTPKETTGGYNPAIHGDYDPNADYANPTQTVATEQAQAAAAMNPAEMYATTGTFNRFTGKWQNADFTPDRFSDESKSKRQMNAFFDVDAAANSHDGRSLKAERANAKITKKELRAFKDKRREKKEERRRAWLLD